MTTLMPGFKSRRKVDPELIDRYEWEARYYGEKNIKNELSTARRTATSLAKAAAEFKHLRPEHKLALDAATSAMRKLAADLAELVGWAKAYGVFCAAARAAKEAEELAAFAEKRWGSDSKAMEFEADVIVELVAQNGGEAFGHWMHSIGQHLDVQPNEFSTPFQSVHVRESHNQRMALARVLRSAIDHPPNKWKGMRGMTYICGWKDYEMYLEHRKAAVVAANMLFVGLSA